MIIESAQDHDVEVVIITIQSGASSDWNGTGQGGVCIRIVGSGVFLLPLPTGGAIFREDRAVGRGPG